MSVGPRRPTGALIRRKGTIVTIGWPSNLLNKKFKKRSFPHRKQIRIILIPLKS